MSHIVTVAIKLTDPDALQKAAQAVGAQVLGEKTHDLFNGQTATGMGFQLQNWTYPLVVEADGSLKYDNYNGRWGDQQQLDEFMQRYAVENTKNQADLYGYTVQEQTAENGDIVLTMQSF